MIKSLIMYSLSLTLATTTVNKCDKMYTKYNLHPKVRSNKGWQNVCKRDKLYLYINKNKKLLNHEDIDYACKCLMLYGKYDLILKKECLTKY